LSYDHYQELLVPERLRRPLDQDGQAKGGWENRPDHDRSYPDILVSIELHPTFGIARGTSQSIWADIYVPKGTPAGIYEGVVTVTTQGSEAKSLSVKRQVYPMTLPDLPTAKTMLHRSMEDINKRYIGSSYLDNATMEDLRRSRKVIDRHFQMSHRHRISLIHEHIQIPLMDRVWGERLDGTLFKPDRGYAGPGVGVGNNVYSIGTYGTWDWKAAGKEAVWANTDDWLRYFEKKALKTPTEFFCISRTSPIILRKLNNGHVGYWTIPDREKI